MRELDCGKSRAALGGARGHRWALRGGGGFREEATPLRSLQGGEGNSQATKQGERECSNGDDADSQEY